MAGRARSPEQPGKAKSVPPALRLSPERRRFAVAEPTPVRPTAQGARDEPLALFILRPVGTTLLMAALLLVGIVAYRFCRSRRCLRSTIPTIQVSTFYPGASPEVMTTAVTAPLERQFGEMPASRR